MSLHIVIDGYNLIHQSRQFGGDASVDIQTIRQKLVDVLAAYKKIKPHAITIVFDGTAAPADLPRRDRLKGIDLRFSRPGELADAVIKRMAAREKEKMLVVSSDRDISAYAAARGAAVMGAAEFEERLIQARYYAEHDTGPAELSEGWNASTRKKGPSKRLPKRERKMRTKTIKL